MTLFFYIIIAIITFFAFLHAWAKKEYDFSRTVVVNRSREEVYSFVRQLRKQPLWMPWFNRDPDANLKYKGIDGKLDAAFYWKGNGKVGEGYQKIVKIRQGKVIETKIIFIKPFKLNALTYIGVKEIEAEKTKMVWGVRGHIPFPLTIIGIFYSVDKLLARDFEEGLKNLKTVLEK
ncbi:SRPBCC family protein [Zunongwangia sp. F363]|uniref:SRPBCC family protein n=1 Tax=Autumnicola tepida TaxID=3075595 RepID=A0ABU3CEF8_9FLAO|nr:SRPBCC family protein [Zunongwangia sp. F363]MDT0644738.1 SRPBCC family protein [Zunongwangia sp. F363]